MAAPLTSATLRPALGLTLGFTSFALLLWVGVKPTLAGINSDGAVYVLLADGLSPWRATDIDFGAQLFAHYPFPPLYPLLLAAVGGGSAVPALDYIVDALLQAMAVVASWCWARRIGCDGPAAAIAALSLAITPIALFTAMGVFSEPLYLALSMTALALVAGPEISARAWRGAALLLGLAAVTRGVGLFAAAVLLLVWAWRTRGRHARLVPLLALAPSLAWLLIKASHGWQGSYTDTLFAGGVLRVTAALVAQLPTNLHALAYHFVRCFDSLNSRHSALILATLLIPAGLGFGQRLRAGQVDACYAALYLLVLLLWPYPNHFARFLLVLLPLFCAYACQGVALMLIAGGQVALRPFAGAVTAAVLFLVMLPSLLQVLQNIAAATSAPERLHTRISSWYGHDSLAAARASTAFSLRVLDVMATVGKQLPRAACVSSTMAEVFMLHGRRLSRPPPSQRAELASLQSALVACPYVLLLGATAFPAADFPRYYPLARVKDELVILLTVPLDAARPEQPPLAVLARYRGPGATAPAPPHSAPME